MGILNKLSRLFAVKNQENDYISLPKSRLPEKIANDQYVYCYKDGKKTVLLQAGNIPEKLVEGEMCVVIIMQKFSLDIEIDNLVYKLDLEFEFTDSLAGALSVAPFTNEIIDMHCRNALQAVKNILPEGSSLERWRAKVSLALMNKGLRCNGLEINEKVVDERNREDLIEYETYDGIKETLEMVPEEFTSRDEVCKIENILAHSDDLSAEDISQLEVMAEKIYARIEEHFEETKDVIALELRLEELANEPLEQVSFDQYPATLGDISKPSTLFTVRRSVLDKKLRSFLLDSLTNSIVVFDSFKKDKLLYDYGKLAQAYELLKILQLCRDRIEIMPELKHDFRAVRMSNDEIKQRIQYIKKAADCVVGLNDTISELCCNSVKSTAFSVILAEAKSGAEKLNWILAGKGGG